MLCSKPKKNTSTFSSSKNQNISYRIEDKTRTILEKLSRGFSENEL